MYLASFVGLVAGFSIGRGRCLCLAIVISIDYSKHLLQNKPLFMSAFLNFLETGLLNFSAWQMVLYTFIVVQVTLSGVSLYLHREQTHRGIQMNPVIQHF